MPFDLSLLGQEGRELNNEWKKELKKHARYTVKNEYFKNQNMEAWYKKEQDINNHYRNLIKDLEKKKRGEQEVVEQERKEAKSLLKEADKLLKQSEEKEREERIKARKNIREKREKERQEMKKKDNKTSSLKGNNVSKKSGNRARKTERKRCPNGTRRNKTTGNCEQK